ncbi:MAG TPA: hypothetical protein VFN92_10665 [Solirubrobacterales bacterium]|nr:hypothetical protein [Solirubrobacterales bacterium]
MKPLVRYLRRDVWPRRQAILFQGQTVLAVAVTLAIGIWGGDLAFDDLQTDKLVAAVLAYAALALGFCLAGLTIALTLPDRSFAKFLADYERQPEAKGARNAFSELVFVFSWTATAHWAVIVISLVTLVTQGSSTVPTFGSDCTAGAALIALLLGMLTYALAQFLVTVLTLSEVARVYITWMRGRGKNTTEPQDE